MAKATCRCGHALTLPDAGDDRVVCPKCGARVRVRRSGPTGSGSAVGDGFLRFSCPCGRRLKVRAEDAPEHGKCPDCGRVVPVPAPSRAGAHPEADTAEMSPEQRAALERWAARFAGIPPVAHAGADDDDTPVSLGPARAGADDRAEAGLRVCPNCRRPIHLGADTCRACGTAVPRKAGG
jgi:DNA-directed RNA polymerase subunit M/transcription elongation factor TFIIS